MSALGHKQTSRPEISMSALPPKAEISGNGCDVRGKQAHALQQRTLLFDHLIGSRKQFVWDGKSERLGGLEIDDQLILCRHLHGEIGGLP
jgi:hypothetical protein